LLSKFDCEVNEGLLLLDKLLVLDPIVARIDLANQVEPLLLLFLGDGAIGNLVIKHGEFVLVGLVLLLALVLVCVQAFGLALLDDNLLCYLSDRGLGGLIRLRLFETCIAKLGALIFQFVLSGDLLGFGLRLLVAHVHWGGLGKETADSDLFVGVCGRCGRGAIIVTLGWR